MPNYRRDFTPGASYFFTVNLFDRRRSLLTDHLALLRDCVARERAARPFAINAWTVLPDHMHWLWTLPPGDSDYPTRWRRIKTSFAKALATRPVWQPRYWEHRIRDEPDRQRHIDYIHYNAVKHGLVERPVDWPHSSFDEFVKRGVYSSDWYGPA